jgi:hypothetical protein
MQTTMGISLLLGEDVDVTTPPVKQTLGRCAIPIELIEDRARRRVTFCKRRKGLAKKTLELHKLTGCEIMMLVVGDSPDPSTILQSMHVVGSPRFEQMAKEEPFRAMITRLFNESAPT